MANDTLKTEFKRYMDEATGMIAPEPDSVMGIKILEVDSLLDDESLSSVRAAFAEDFFRARRNSLALKN